MPLRYQLIWRQARCGTGLPALDEQHRTLVDTANRVLAMLSGDTSAGKENVLADFMSQARAHFAFEEGLMRGSGFPGYEVMSGNMVAFSGRWNSLSKITSINHLLARLSLPLSSQTGWNFILLPRTRN